MTTKTDTEQEREALLPCPFCGEPAYVERWGSNRQSCIIGCQSCGCSMETGETGHDCGGMWNHRAALQSQDREYVPAYRLLGAGEIIQADDEFIANDGVTWSSAGTGLWVGMPYTHTLKSARRRIEGEAK